MKQALLFGPGFLGHNVREVLQKKEYAVYSISHDNYDLTIKKDAVEACYFPTRLKIPELVVFTAGFNGGILMNRERPADIFYENTVMALNVIRGLCKVYPREELEKTKFVTVYASCAYPYTPNNYYPKNEYEALSGIPDSSVKCHAYAKRNLLLALDMYNQQYGLKSAICCPNTLFGPGDHYEPERSKVAAALVRKFVDAKLSGKKTVEVFGDGSAKRSFLYVKDAAEMIIKVAESDFEKTSLPYTLYNLPCLSQISIRELAETIKRVGNFDAEIVFTGGPVGAKEKDIDTTKYLEKFGPSSLTPLDVALKGTIESYEQQAKEQLGNSNN